MLLVQEYLEHHTFGDLIRDHGVYASVAKNKLKFSLNYDMIESKETDPLAQECRGLILTPADGKPLMCEIDMAGKRHYENSGPGKTKVLAYPMRRFFNHGQGCAASIDWSDPKLTVLEKLDGTLCIVYFDTTTDHWCVATRSVPDADIVMDNGLFTFRTLFEKAVQDILRKATDPSVKLMDFHSFTKFLDKDYTYCFELTTPYNRIVVNYPDNKITLLAVRGLFTGQELDFSHPLIADRLAGVVPIVQSHTLSTIEETVNWVSTTNPMEHEGVVVRQGDNRIKVKSPAYVAFNKVRDKLATSERNCVELILAEKDDDVISFLPEEIVKNLQKIKIGLQGVLQKYDAAYQEALSKVTPGDKKAFALLITQDKTMWTAPFFQMFDGKASNMKDFIAKNRKDGSWGDSFLDKLLEMSKKLIV